MYWGIKGFLITNSIYFAGNGHLLYCSNLWRRLLTHYQNQHCVMDAAEDIKVVKRTTVVPTEVTRLSRFR